MSKVKRCLSDIRDKSGNSFPRDEDHPDVVTGVQMALCFIDWDDRPYRKGIETGTPLSIMLDEDGEKTPVGPPEHGSECVTGSFAVLPANQGLQPLDLLVPVDAPLTEVGSAALTFTNECDRRVQCQLDIGIHQEIRILTERFNALFTQARYEITGPLDGDKQALGHQQFTSGDEFTDEGGSIGIRDWPARFPQACCFQIECGETVNIEVAIDQRVRGYDGESQIASVRTDWNLWCSTMKD